MTGSTNREDTAPRPDSAQGKVNVVGSPASPQAQNKCQITWREAGRGNTTRESPFDAEKRERGRKRDKWRSSGEQHKGKSKTLPLLHLDSLSPASSSSVNFLFLSSLLTSTFSHQLFLVPQFKSLLFLFNFHLCTNAFDLCTFLKGLLRAVSAVKFQLWFFCNAVFLTAQMSSQDVAHDFFRSVKGLHDHLWVN